MKRCVAYCRVSTDHKDQKNSIEAQKRNYMELFSNIEYNPAPCGMLYKIDGTTEPIIGIFADEGRSGTSLKNRNAFNEMIKMAYNKEFDIIYTPSVSRFARSVEDGAKIVKDLRVLGIAVYFEDKRINTLEIKSDFEINLYFSLAQQESEQKSVDIKRGIRSLHRQGGWNASAPYGYDITNGYLEINQEEAEIVKRIFNQYHDEGYGTIKIAKHLIEDEISSKKGITWSHVTICRMLENPLYIGLQTVHTVESVDVNRKTKKAVPVAEHITTEKPELRIIEHELFSKVQIERERRRKSFKNGKRHSNEHPYSTLLVCGHCGATFRRKKRKAYKRKDGTINDLGYEWLCSNADKYGKAVCEHRNAIVEPDLLKQIQYELFKLQTEDMGDLFELYLAVNFSYTRTEEHVKRLKDKLEKLKEEKRNMLSYLAKNIIDEAEFEIFNADNKKQTEDLTYEIERIEHHDYRVEVARKQYKQYMKEIKEFDINNLTNAGLKRLFKSITVRTINNKNIGRMRHLEFNYNFMDITIAELEERAREKKLKVKEAMNGGQIIYLDM